MVNGADAATLYGVVSFLFSCTRYAPGSTLGGPDPLMSPCVSASAEAGKETCTTVDWWPPRSTRVKPTRRCGGTTTLLIGWLTKTGTMSVPAVLPWLVTVNVAVATPLLDTLGVTDRLLVSKGV